MRTTIELPDDLFRQAKATAALQDRSLKDLVADGVRLVLHETASAYTAKPRRRTVFPLINAQNPPLQSSPEDLKQALLEEESARHVHKPL